MEKEVVDAMTIVKTEFQEALEAFLVSEFKDKKLLNDRSTRQRIADFSTGFFLAHPLLNET